MNDSNSTLTTNINVSSKILPTVSWLICAHVLNDQLRIALQSCLDQTFNDFEIVLVLNGPNASVIFNKVQEWFPDEPKIHTLQTNIKFLNFSLSLGLNYARAQLIARMDSDDIAKPDRLSKQVEFMNNNSSVIVLGSAYELINDKGISQILVKTPLDNLSIRKAMLWSNPICHPSVMFRKASVIEVGGYLGGIFAEDYDLWTRLARVPGNHFANLEDVCIGYRTKGVGQARRSRLAYASMATSQFNNFLNRQGFRWLLALFITSIKLLTRSERN
jgi:cellulose synthase/poly-beta-1,6-N-acetylglucosamine synthase-like glycosyltransferase